MITPAVARPGRVATRWEGPPDVAVLVDGEIECWRVSIAECDTALPAWRALLSADERSRRDALRFERDRDRFVVARALQRLVLARYLGCAPSALAFMRGAHGKPALSSPAETGLGFNLSDSGDLVLMAVARRREVGIDVEQWAADLDSDALDELAGTAFSDAECAMLAAAAADDRPRAFFAIWSRKEAYIKATADGLSQGLAHFDVSADADDARLLQDRRAPRATDAWALTALDVGTGYAGALAWSRPANGPEPIIRTWHVNPAHFSAAVTSPA